MAMLLSHSCEGAEFTRPTSSRAIHRHSSARVHGTRSGALQAAIVEERKQRSRSKIRKQRIRSNTGNSDRRDKWEELHTSEVPEEIPSSPPRMVEVARFSDGIYDWRRLEDDKFRLERQEEKRKGGWFLVVNPATRMAALQRYQSRDGCDSCGFFLVESDDGVSDALEPALKLAVPCLEMYRRAKQCVDPRLEFRRMRKDDFWYDAATALYASYLHFHEQTFVTPRPERQPCPVWKCRVWSKHDVRAVVKLQALWRGWYFRQRVLFSPHTQIGRRLLERQWQLLQGPYVESVSLLHSVF